MIELELNERIVVILMMIPTFSRKAPVLKTPIEKFVALPLHTS